MTIITASELEPGMQLPEADGFLFDVTEVVKVTAKTITIRLTSNFSSIEKHWTIRKNGQPGGVLKTFRKSTRLYAVI